MSIGSRDWAQTAIHTLSQSGTGSNGPSLPDAV